MSYYHILKGTCAYILGYIGQDRIKFRAELPLGIPSKGAATFPLDLTGKWQIFFVETQELVPPDINPYDSWSLLFFSSNHGSGKWGSEKWVQSQEGGIFHFSDCGAKSPLPDTTGFNFLDVHFQLSGCMSIGFFWPRKFRVILEVYLLSALEPWSSFQDVELMIQIKYNVYLPDSWPVKKFSALLSCIHIS